MGPDYYGYTDDYYGYTDDYEDGRVSIGDGNYGELKNIAVLPHHCDSWQIGGKKQVREMIADLKKILKDPKLIEDASAKNPEGA